MTKSIIYFIQRGDGLVKIGTTTSLKQRLAAIRQKNGKLSFLGYIEGGFAREKVLHWCFRSDNVFGEWFNPTDELMGLIELHAEKVTPSIEAIKAGSAKKRFTLDLTDEQLNKWRAIAKQNGFTIGRGELASEGSVQKYMEAVLDGQLNTTTEEAEAPPAL